MPESTDERVRIHAYIVSGLKQCRLINYIWVSELKEKIRYLGCFDAWGYER